MTVISRRYLSRATAWRRHEYTIELFVRPPREGKYLYAGKLAPSYVMPYSSDGDCGMAAFRLEPTLPSSIWVQLGGIRLGDQNVAGLDQALARLRQQTTVHDRLAILQQLVQFWHGPIRPEDGLSDAEMTSPPIPLPLRWWYRFAGKRSEIMSGQNILFAPRDFETRRMLQIVNDRLLFYVENKASISGRRCNMVTTRRFSAASKGEAAGRRKASRCPST